MLNSMTDSNGHLIRSNDLMNEQNDILRGIRDAIESGGYSGGGRAGINYGGRNMVNAY